MDWLTPLRTHGLLQEGVLSAFVVGSAARGWHNARSDFDIYVVTGAERTARVGTRMAVALDPPYVRKETFVWDNRRWEVTYWQDRQIGQVLDKISWQAYESGLIEEDPLTRQEELLLAHLGTSLPILGEEWLREARARLLESAFRSYAVVRSLGAVDDGVEDALGQMEADDLESATISARIAFGHAIDALLESEGEYGSYLPKWRPHRLRACAPKAVSFADYWDIETMRGYDQADPGPWIKYVLTVCQDIAIRLAV